MSRKDNLSEYLKRHHFLIYQLTLKDKTNHKMKFKLYYIISFLSMLIIFSSYNHPIKLTSSLIEYDLKTKKMSMECRVFIDDFQDALNIKDWNVSKLSKENIEAIEYYFDEFYPVMVSDKKLSWVYKTSDVYGANNVLGLKFEVVEVDIEKGDELLIENKLFFLEFAFLQNNQMTVRMPPFVTEKFFESTHEDYSIQFTL